MKRWYSQFLRRLGLDIKSVEVAKFLKSNPDEQEFRIGLRDPCEACAARGADCMCEFLVDEDKFLKVTQDA